VYGAYILKGKVEWEVDVRLVLEGMHACMDGWVEAAWTEGRRNARFSERKNELLVDCLKRKIYFLDSYVLS
jgi:hypothetical protein